MVEDSAPLSELPPVSLIVQSSRVSPTGGKCPATVSEKPAWPANRLRVATQSEEAQGDFRETDWKAVVAANLDVWVVLLECLIEVPADMETILFEAKRGRWESDRSCERLSVWEELSLWWLWEEKHMPEDCPQGWRNASTLAALGSHAGAKNTGSLAVSEVVNRSMNASHWWRRSWTTS